MIDKDTPIGTLCQLSKTTKHVVRYIAHENGEMFIGELIETDFEYMKKFIRQVTLHFGSLYNSILSDSCNHEYVNVSFNQIKMACKYCGKDKEYLN